MIAREQRRARSARWFAGDRWVRLCAGPVRAFTVVILGSCLLGGDGRSDDYLPGDTMAPWEGGPAYYDRWENGPTSDPDFFPIAVWLQSPSRASAYRAIGVNLFVGLWNGPTPEQLSSLVATGMSALCSQNEVGLSDSNNHSVVAWTHQDEPDNAQPDGSGGYTSPISPSAVVAGYQAMRANDPTRPVYLNLGQGVAWDGWYGRLDRTNHPEDYPEYAKGADILSFDIYPVNADRPEVSGKLWLVPYGVERLREWCNYEKAVWNWIECTHIRSEAGRKPTPAEVKAEVWMSIIHGAMGIGYFAHTISPFDEPGLLHDPDMAAAVSAINSQITRLARVVNTRSVANGVVVTTSDSLIPVDTMVKRLDGTTYVFAVPMRPGTTRATFQVRGFAGKARVTVVDEGREIEMADGSFEDVFSDYEVHIYALKH